MTLIGYTMMGEQAGPKQLVREVALAEQAGFDFAVISDYYFPKVRSTAPAVWRCRLVCVRPARQPNAVVNPSRSANCTSSADPACPAIPSPSQVPRTAPAAW